MLSFSLLYTNDNLETPDKLKHTEVHSIQMKQIKTIPEGEQIRPEPIMPA